MPVASFAFPAAPELMFLMLLCQPLDDENNLESDEEKGSTESAEARLLFQLG